MARVVVDVMPKPEILDPQGKAVLGALPRLGFDGVTDVRQGKRFELEVDGEVTDERLAEVREMAETLLSNPVIEDFAVERSRGRAREGRRRHLPGLARRRRRRSAPYASAGGEAVALWHGDHDLQGVDAVVLPGGFSYGDYLRCGAIARFAPVMTEVVAAAGGGHAGARHLQRLPDPLRVAPAARRADPQRPPQVRLPRPAAARSRTTAPPGPRRTPRAPRSPSCSRTARAASSPTSATLDRLEGEGRVVARYLDVNPNGSLRDIAGITNERGNVVGLMPHPEHAVEDLTAVPAPTGSASSPASLAALQPTA